MTPIVSVIMAVYNGQKYLDKSIQSILQQSLECLEFIIINDASTDDSRAIIDRFLDKRITAFDNKERMGLTKCLNTAIQHSTGKYIARMDADDIADPERLREQVTYLETHPQVGLVGTNFYEINENDNFLGEVYLPENDEKIRKKIFRFNPFFHSSVMIPWVVFETVGFYCEKYQYAQDYELWFRILEKYKGTNLRDLLMKRRKHKETLTQKKLHLQSNFAYKAWIEGKNRISPSFLKQFWILKYYIMNKLPSQFLLTCNKLRPHNLRYYFSGYYIRKLH